jgi:hypothetical protein
LLNYVRGFRNNLRISVTPKINSIRRCKAGKNRDVPPIEELASYPQLGPTLS